MIAKTYTSIWNEEKKIYAIHELTLPVPVGFKQIGLFVFAAIIWMPIMAVIGVPFMNPFGLFTWFVVPIALAAFGNKQIFEGKSIIQYVSSAVSFMFEPKRILDGVGISEKAEKFPDEKTKTHDSIEEKYIVWTREPLERI